MSLPSFFDPKNAERYEYSPNQQLLQAESGGWRLKHKIGPAADDKTRIHLVLIDQQKDFCFPNGALYVGGRSGRGALDDNLRIAQFIYNNLARLTNITATLDTHLAFQIFFSSFWVDSKGEPLMPYREIRLSQIDSGEVRPNPAMAGWLCNSDYDWLAKQARYYCAELEKAGKYSLYLWPPHCILGSDGHALVGVVHEARMFHSFVRYAQSWNEIKGANPLTENYSVLRPEVLGRFDGAGALAEKNSALINRLLAADVVIIAGEAASHCVKSSIEDLLGEILLRDKRLAGKIYILSDCMSAVAIPDAKGGFVADFTQNAEEAFARFSDAGMHLVRSTEPIESWPGIGF